jgi:hypothetical protein
MFVDDDTSPGTAKSPLCALSRTHSTPNQTGLVGDQDPLAIVEAPLSQVLLSIGQLRFVRLQQAGYFCQAKTKRSRRLAKPAPGRAQRRTSPPASSVATTPLTRRSKGTRAHPPRSAAAVRRPDSVGQVSIPAARRRVRNPPYGSTLPEAAHSWSFRAESRNLRVRNRQISRLRYTPFRFPLTSSGQATRADTPSPAPAGRS